MPCAREDNDGDGDNDEGHFRRLRCWKMLERGRKEEGTADLLA